MAVTADGFSPIIMDAAGDLLSSVFQTRDMNSDLKVARLWLIGAEFVAEAGGTGVLNHVSDGVVKGIAFQSPNLSAGQNWYVKVDRWVGDLRCSNAWPAGMKVLLHYA